MQNLIQLPPSRPLLLSNHPVDLMLPFKYEKCFKKNGMTHSWHAVIMQSPLFLSDCDTISSRNDLNLKTFSPV